MKTLLVRLVLPALAGLCVTSCADSVASRGPGPGVNTLYSAYGTGFVTYSTLPVNYTGAAYRYQGRYYTGGRLETGRFTHQGQTYATRYYHNGRYYYGGTHQYYSAAPYAATSRRPYGARMPRDSSLHIGANVINTPMVNTTTSRNADIYSTSATRGPAISLTSPWGSRRSYANGPVSGR